MNRITIIQSLIDKYQYKWYLEIGVREGSCLNEINCERKTGVDPDPASAAPHKYTSDKFFDILSKDYTWLFQGQKTPPKFDIIFIDGLHHADQVEKDILNSLKYLNEGGTIVMHDCLPTTERMQLLTTDPTKEEWTGDVWKAFVKMRIRDDLEMFVVDTDYGCGVITRGSSEPLMLASTAPNSELTYNDFVKNKDVWMNRRTVDWFKNYYLKS